MRARTEYLTFDTRKHREHVNITGEVAALARRSGIGEGMVLVELPGERPRVPPGDSHAGRVEFGGRRPERLVIKATGE
jgi:hypothetical protein